MGFRGVAADGDGCRWKPDTGRVYLQGVGHVKVHAHRAVQGRGQDDQPQAGRPPLVRGAVLRRRARPPLPATGREIGVDVGVARFATTSDGEVIANPRFHPRPRPGELAAAQQALARKKRGSANRRRARAKVAEVHRRIRNRRADFHHKTARALVQRVRRDRAGKPEHGRDDQASRTETGPGAAGRVPPERAAAKSGLNRSILDAGWAQFAGILAAKAEEAGRRVVFVNPAYTSIDCHQCGRQMHPPAAGHCDLPRARRAWTPTSTGPRNIYTRAGLGSGQAMRPEKLAASAVRAVTELLWPSFTIHQVCLTPASRLDSSAIRSWTSGLLSG